MLIACCIPHNMLLRFEGPNVIETGVDWARADGSKDSGPLLDVQPNMGPRVNHEPARRGGRMHGESMDKLVAHFI